ncbi:MAG: hypothetical protein CR984_00020 [Proteobacteria bacterium]|nr:MAG: hypothetical protein CR984_00020 [Pseudomonadota bacterium]
MKFGRFATIIFVFFLCGVMFQFGPAAAADWVTLKGIVTYQDKPVCGMVLINGQYMFSCAEGDDFGKYELSAPLDPNGLLTIYVFVSGLAPFRQITDSYGLTFNVAMQTSEPGSPSPDVTIAVDPGEVSPADWVRISGTVNFDDTPICGMVLANGQYMFSCKENLGVYDLTVPLDHKGQITHYVFVAGKQPYKRVFTPKIKDASACFLNREWVLRTRWEHQPQDIEFGTCSISINGDGTLFSANDSCLFDVNNTGQWALLEYQDDGSRYLNWRWDAYPETFYQAPVSQSLPCTIKSGTMHNLEAEQDRNEGRWYLEVP